MKYYKPYSDKRYILKLKIKIITMYNFNEIEKNSLKNVKSI